MAFQGDSIFWVEVDKVVPNPFQPRREFDEEKLKELAESVRMYGILQPLTVTRKEIHNEDGTFYTQYELIAGERRLRASRLAGLSQVPVIIREGEESEQEKLELAIIENLQREDLNAVDRALAFQQLAQVFKLTHTQIARKMGRSREYVANSVRLLGLPDYMLSALRKAELTEGHARTLLMINDRPEEQDVVFREILLKKLSVREVERIVRKIATDKVRNKTRADIDTELIEIEKRFMETLGTRVQIQKTEYGGRLTIDYFSTDDLEHMLTRMKQEQGEKMASAYTAVAAIEAATPLIMLDDTGVEPAARSDASIMAEQPQEVVAETYVPQEDPTPAEFMASEVASVMTFEQPPVPALESDLPSQDLFVPTPAPVPMEVPSVAEAVNTEVMGNPFIPQVPQPALDPLPPVVTPIPEPVITPPVAPTPPAKDSDESDLYSMRNFGI